MFTLYWIVKRSVAETVLNKASLLTLEMLLSEQFLLWCRTTLLHFQNVLPALQRSSCSCSDYTRSILRRSVSLPGTV